ncbi:ubiquitin-specific protease ubp2 [Coniosporium tulheliwenetii]|uniref:Ubiquitin-specific protease ubp2 n=1 Tax=Coniosporium tulheliwenetii TaxID=3383036 RepID=A0ACC2ZIH3_9PEZI|nr:ubiquitin-specific protease ubp2 [Cladosporium sp. JES 115]
MDGDEEFRARSFAFECTAPQCPAALSIRLKPPRLRPEHIELLTDPDLLRIRFEAAVLKDPDRADARPARPAEVLNNLNLYLRDALDVTKPHRRIPGKNRKFMTAFGEDCTEILEYLNFTYIPPASAYDEDFWSPPDLAAETDPERAEAIRNFLEDVREELLALIHQRPIEEVRTLRNFAYDFQPATKSLEEALGCSDYERAASSRRNVDLTQPEHPYYASLGALSDFSDNLLAFAYDRQVQCDPINAPYYFECLEDLSRGRNSETLNMKVAMLSSEGKISRKDVSNAYAYFNIEMSHVPHISDDHIIGQFQSRLSDIAASQAPEMRRQLRIIGEARGSSKILNAADNALETYDQALSWLGATAGLTDDFILTCYTAKISDSPGDEALGRKAVEIIAEARNSVGLRNWLRTADLVEPELDVGEAYSILQIDDRSTALSGDSLDAILASRLDEAPGRADEFQRAAAVIRQTINNMPMDSTSFPRGNQPAGLHNIGNTCYLNSILQLLFAIKPLRELVLDINEFKMDINDEKEMARKRVGRAAQKEHVHRAQDFVDELAALFKEMMSTPNQWVVPKEAVPAKAVSGLEVEEHQPVATAPDETMPDTLPATVIPNDTILQTDTIMQSTEQDESVVADPASDMEVELGDDVSQATLVDKDGNDESKDKVSGGDADQANSVSLRKDSFTFDEAPIPLSKQESNWAAPDRPAPQPPQPEGEKSNFKPLQRDAKEVMDNILHLLELAIRPDGHDSDGEQLDLIKQQKGPRGVNQALDERLGISADQTTGKLRYDWLENLPPILALDIMRADFDTAKGKAYKVMHHLQLEDTIYMDRFLAPSKSPRDSALAQARERAFAASEELERAQERYVTLTELKDGLQLHDAVDAVADWLPEAKEEGLPLEDAEALAGQLTQKAADLREEMQTLEVKIPELKNAIREPFKDMKQHPYRLFALFLHSGLTTGSGHYFCYIRDFEAGVWRKYNDENVSVVSEAEVYGESGGVMPTYAVYVRDQEKEQLVDPFPEESKRAGERVPEFSGVHAGDTPMPDAVEERVMLIEGVDPVLGRDNQAYPTPPYES